MKVYVDAENRCHLANDGKRKEIYTDAFEEKCAEYVEGFEYLDNGKYSTFSPWKPWHELDAAQRICEREQLDAVKRENEELLADLAAMVDVVYETDVERIEA